MRSSNWPEEQLEHVACDYCSGDDFRSVAARPDGLRVVECWRCGLAFVNPRPSEKFIARLYGKDYFDNYAGSDYKCLVDEAVAKGTTRELKYVERFVELRGKRLLDVGCAYGAFLHVAGLRGAEVEGVEISEHAARIAQQKLGLTVHVGTLGSAGLAERPYDVVTAFEVIEHDPRPASFAEELARLVAPDGLLVLSVPNYGCERLYGDRWLGFHWSPEHLYYFSEDVLRRMFGRLGLRPLSVDTVGIGRPPTVEDRRTKLRAGTSRALEITGLLGLVRRVLTPLRKQSPVPFGDGHRLFIAMRKARGTPPTRREQSQRSCS